MSSEHESLSDTWISWFCTLRGHEFFCEISKEWIEDSFNLYGLRHEIGPRYDECLDLILDRLSHNKGNKLVMQDACVLYGHIHSRFILTTLGLQAMHHKYNMRDFGRCPRFACHSQPVVPIGLSDRVCQEHVKVYCVRCKQVYEPSYPGVQSVDGAFFGTTFAHLFFMSFDHLLPSDASDEFEPRIFGFRIHSSSPLSPRFIATRSSDSGALVCGTVAPDLLSPGGSMKAGVGLGVRFRAGYRGGGSSGGVGGDGGGGGGTLNDGDDGGAGVAAVHAGTRRGRQPDGSPEQRDGWSGGTIEGTGPARRRRLNGETESAGGPTTSPHSRSPLLAAHQLHRPDDDSVQGGRATARDSDCPVWPDAPPPTSEDLAVASSVPLAPPGLSTEPSAPLRVQVKARP